jgi:hypothetical protein
MKRNVCPTNKVKLTKATPGSVCPGWNDDALRQSIEALSSPEVRALMQPEVDRMILMGALEPDFVL